MRRTSLSRTKYIWYRINWTPEMHWIVDTEKRTSHRRERKYIVVSHSYEYIIVRCDSECTLINTIKNKYTYADETGAAMRRISERLKKQASFGSLVDANNLVNTRI